MTEVVRFHMYFEDRAQRMSWCIKCGVREIEEKSQVWFFNSGLCNWYNGVAIYWVLSNNVYLSKFFFKAQRKICLFYKNGITLALKNSTIKVTQLPGRNSNRRDRQTLKSKSICWPHISTHQRQSPLRFPFVSFQKKICCIYKSLWVCLFAN